MNLYNIRTLFPSQSVVLASNSLTLILQVPPAVKDSLSDLSTDMYNVQHLMACQQLTKVDNFVQSEKFAFFHYCVLRHLV